MAQLLLGQHADNSGHHYCASHEQRAEFHGRSSLRLSSIPPPSPAIFLIATSLPSSRDPSIGKFYTPTMYPPAFPRSTTPPPSVSQPFAPFRPPTYFRPSNHNSTLFDTKWKCDEVKGVEDLVKIDRACSK